jgi:hypothetical protein
MLDQPDSRGVNTFVGPEDISCSADAFDHAILCGSNLIMARLECRTRLGWVCENCMPARTSHHICLSFFLWPGCHIYRNRCLKSINEAS